MLPLGIGAQGGQRSGVYHRFGSASLFPIFSRYHDVISHRLGIGS